MSNTPLRGVAGAYRHIIDDVVTRVRTDFVQEGVDECVQQLSPATICACRICALHALGWSSCSVQELWASYLVTDRP
jgi:hypothetical protein